MLDYGSYLVVLLVRRVLSVKEAQSFNTDRSNEI